MEETKPAYRVRALVQETHAIHLKEVVSTCEWRVPLHAGKDGLGDLHCLAEFQCQRQQQPGTLYV